MALKAGRVGVAPNQVDSEGKIIVDSATGVTDVKVGGTSVVSDGVASITIPVTDVKVDGVSVVSDGVAEITISSSNSIEETNNPSEADFATIEFVHTGADANNLIEISNGHSYTSTEVTIGSDTIKVLKETDDAATETLAIPYNKELIVDFNLTPGQSTIYDFELLVEFGGVIRGQYNTSTNQLQNDARFTQFTGGYNNAGVINVYSKQISASSLGTTVMRFYKFNH